MSGKIPCYIIIVFRDSGYVILYPQARSATDGYPSFTGNHKQAKG